MATSKKTTTKKTGPTNSLVGNINARKKKGISRSKADTTISEKAYEKMKNNWGRKRR